MAPDRSAHHGNSKDRHTQLKRAARKSQVNHNVIEEGKEAAAGVTTRARTRGAELARKLNALIAENSGSCTRKAVGPPQGAARKCLHGGGGLKARKLQEARKQTAGVPVEAEETADVSKRAPLTLPLEPRGQNIADVSGKTPTWTSAWTPIALTDDALRKSEALLAELSALNLPDTDAFGFEQERHENPTSADDDPISLCVSPAAGGVVLPELDMSAKLLDVVTEWSAYRELQALSFRDDAFTAVEACDSNGATAEEDTSAAVEVQHHQVCELSSPEDLLEDITSSIQKMAQVKMARDASRCRIDSCETDVTESDVEMASSTESNAETGSTVGSTAPMSPPNYETSRPCCPQDSEASASVPEVIVATKPLPASTAQSFPQASEVIVATKPLSASTPQPRSRSIRHAMTSAEQAATAMRRGASPAVTPGSMTRGASPAVTRRKSLPDKVQCPVLRTNVGFYPRMSSPPPRVHVPQTLAPGACAAGRRCKVEVRQTVTVTNTISITYE